jgi:hypothetical protein
MITLNIELDDDEVKTFNFPTSWDEITVEQFSRLFENPTTTTNELENTIKIISSLSDVPEEILYAMDIQDFKSLSSNLGFIGQEVTTNKVDYVEINDEKYYLYKDFDKFTTGEIITIELIMESTQGNIYKVMSKLLCLFLRKKKPNGKFEKFTTDMLEREELFKKVKISHIHHIFNFFSTGETIFNPNIQDFIKEI